MNQATSLNASTHFLCVCKKYNFGRPHPVSHSTWYQHINEAETDEEKQRIQSAKCLDEPDQHDCSGTPMNPHSSGSLSSTQCHALVHAMSKRWHDSAENTSRGRRKRARATSRQVSPAPPPHDHDEPVPLPHDHDEPVPPPHDSSFHAGQLNNIFEHRTQPAIDIEALAQSAVLSSMHKSMQFIQALANVSLEDPVSKLDEEALARLCSPPDHVVSIDSPGIRYSISTYLALENASQKAYNRVCEAARTNFAGAPGVENILSFYNVERTIAMYTGVDSIEHDMCPNTCLAYTGLFSDLDACPICRKSHWLEEALQGSTCRAKVPAQKFTTIPIGPQIQARYHHENAATEMDYLRRRTNEVIAEIRAMQQIPVLDDIVMGWDYIGAVLDGDIKPEDVVLMVSMDGAQLFDSKESDCWIYIWVIVNLPPDVRYHKLHVCPGGFIPGPNKPKNIDSFLFPGIHHLTSLQKEGLPIWNA
ncbi:hypothetical protein M404DRAFT_142201, partial [Pisolithus tinctorius Marx 270]